MHLITLALRNYKRFREASVNLDARVIAIVGPNEAGKTSLLEALPKLESDEPLETGELTDHEEPAAESAVITAKYLLDASERHMALEVGSTTEPRWMIREKRPDGRVRVRFEPALERDLEDRQSTVQSLVALLNDKDARDLLHTPVVARVKNKAGKQQDETKSLADRLEEAARLLDTSESQLPRTTLSRVSSIVAACGHLVAEFDSVRSVIERLRACVEAERESLEQRLGHQLEGVRPSALLFQPRERNFRSEYTGRQLQQDRPELDNLLSLGGSSLEELARVVRSGDAGSARGLENRVNQSLRQQVGEAWGQSGVYPEIDILDDGLRIHVPAPSTRRGSTLIAERSDGFRAFVSLLAFTRRNSPSAAPILLLDEAEQHLHYDAQADLVAMFHKQDIAAKIVYTTHSAGCLPHDLGSGVRAIEPIRGADGEDSGRSRVVNSFWQEGPGYTPLLLLMGARNLAFAPSRRSLLVFGEGGTELVLLPPMLREVSPTGEIDFQVAPGLANLEYAKLWDVELEAAIVAYVVDGDSEGRRIAAKLKGQGVPDHRVLRLPEGRTIEDLVNRELLAWATNEELRRSGHGLSIRPEELNAPGRARALKQRCEAEGVPTPSKINVARRILERLDEMRHHGADTKLLDSPAHDTARELLAQIQVALAPSSSSGPAAK